MQPLALSLLLAVPALQGTPPCTLAETPTSLGSGLLALSGESLLIAPFPAPRVYVKAGSSWNAQGGNLTTPQTNAVDVTALAIDGDTAVIGYGSNDDQGNDAGSVEIFVRSGSTWTFEQRLYASGPAAGERFGFAAAVDGDVAIVGAPGRGVGGSVFVFERTGSTWSEVDEFEADVPTALGFFGGAVAVSGDSAVIRESTGSAYVFVDGGSGWSQQAVLGVGSVRAVDIDGDTAIVGGNNGTTIFVRNGTSWDEQASFAPNGAPTSNAVAIDGDVAVVGEVTVLESHAMYVRRDTTWSNLAMFGLELDNFVAVALDGGRALYSAASFSIEEVAVPSFVAPSVEHRNAGSNPDSYTSTPAYIGQSLELTVDLSTTGHDQAAVFGFDSAFQLTLGGGQTLLCLDLLGSGGALIDTGFQPGPLVEIDLPVPNDLTLSDFQVCTQALHAFGVVPFALSNAQDIRIGACL